MASSGTIPEVLPSQILSVSPSLPTNKLLDNLTKNQRLLQLLPQNYEKRHYFAGFYKTLLDDFFYSHERADVQLYAAICLADLIRIWAPNLPDAPPEKLLNMFLFLARQLLGLKKIDDPLFSRRYYLLENLSMVQSFIPAVNLEDNRGCQISTVVFNNLFNALQKKHTDQLKNLMIDIVTVILAEYESIPFSLLELLFARIIDPEKKLREECYELVESIIRRGESCLKPAIAEYFKTVLITEDTESLQLHSKIYYVFDELCHISESIVDEIIPTIEHRLTVSNEKHRRDAAKIVAYVTSAPNNDFAQRHKTLWNTFLDQFKNGTSEIQSTCIKHLKSYFVNHPELRADLEDVMVRLSLSTDQNIRSQLMAQIRAITNSSLLNISDKLKQILCERARDKIWEVRKEALDYLGHVYKKECANDNWSNDVQKQLTWVANCIIHLYYQKTTQDKLLAERILTFYLMPWDVNTDDKVRVLLTLYSNVDDNAQRAIREIIQSKFLFRRQLVKLIDFCLQMTDSNISNDDKQLIELKLVSHIHIIALRCLPNPDKNESVLKALAVYAIKNHKQSLTVNKESSILSIFKQAISDGIKSKEVYALANGIGQMLLEEAAKEQKRFPVNTTDDQTITATMVENNGHGQYTKMCGSIKTMFEKISTLLFDQETVSKLLKLIFERVSNEPEQPASYYENINQLLKVFIQHPFIFNCPESLELLCNLLKQRVLELAPILIRTIEVCAPLIIKLNQTNMMTLLNSELSTYLTLHPPIAKRALYCLCALNPNTRDQLLQKLIDDTQYDQFDSDQFITRLVLVGHMIEISPISIGDMGKRILSNISKHIVDKQKTNDDEDNMTTSFFHGNFTLLPDEPHCDPEIGADARVKRELVKAMTRAVLGLQENSASLFNTVYKLMKKCIGNDEDFTGEMSESEIIFIRLCGLSCLLKLICSSYFYSRMKPDDFLIIISLLRDSSSIIRQRTYRKLAEHLRDPTCPIELLALLAFAAKEPEREHREQIRRLMLQIIDTRREHIKLQLSYKTAHTAANNHPQHTNSFNHDLEDDDDDNDNNNNNNNNNDKPIDYTLYPEYSLTYFLFFLSKSPAFILYDDIEMLHTMTDYILFLFDALLLRCDTTVGLFYKGLLRSIKSSEDATIVLEKEEKIERKDAIKKLHVLVDLAYVILSQRASSLMICRASSNVPLPEMYFKKARYNHLSYLPKDFKIKLKPITTTTVSDTLASKRTIINSLEANNSSNNNNTTTITTKSNTTIVSPPKTTRRKRTSGGDDNENDDKEQTLPNKRRKTSANAKQQKRKTSHSIAENEDNNSTASSINRKKLRKNTTNGSTRSRINFPYEKPQLRSASASSISSSPSPPARKTRGRPPSKLAAKN
ncbi:unnamed protein product [Rotaria magnacalcarata]|uniref:Uncharacterized protein n=2 Tax=Rotaria magnacalcarata TaxID=392030 RepID=A0A819PU78_9BILA|nr:unnamed protein product [Rotaria magnacalcarata]CAF4023371.1 unnamed protein product [Rotaria magnacalcarata]